MKPPERTHNAVTVEPAKKGRRKRKADLAFGSALEGTEGEQSADNSASQWHEVFRWACSTLAKLILLFAPLLRPADVCRLCQQLIRILWCRLIAPSSDRVGVSDRFASVEDKNA